MVDAAVAILSGLLKVVLIRESIYRVSGRKLRRAVAGREILLEK
jgi:hypothetical protein